MRASWIWVPQLPRTDRVPTNLAAAAAARRTWCGNPLFSTIGPLYGKNHPLRQWSVFRPSRRLRHFWAMCNPHPPIRRWELISNRTLAESEPHPSKLKDALHCMNMMVHCNRCTEQKPVPWPRTFASSRGARDTTVSTFLSRASRN